MTYRYKYNLISEGDWNIYCMLVTTGKYWEEWCYLDECPLPIDEIVIHWWN